MGREGGSGSCERAELLFLSPLSPQSELQAYMVKEKKIIKKTYKITIEKVILLGEAPLRLRGAFVLLIYIFFNGVSLPPREYRLFGQEFSRVLGEPPWLPVMAPGRGSVVLQAAGTQGTWFGPGKVR